MSAPSASPPSPSSSNSTAQDVILITGANTGVGFQTALQLAVSDPGGRRHLVLACRSPSKAQAAVEKIQTALAPGQATAVEWVELDLADLRSIQRCLGEVRARRLAVKILICNAGVNVAPQLGQPSFHVDGQFVANYLGHYYLTKGLMPLLEASAPGARVINVSSYMHRTAGGHPDFARQCRRSDSASYSTSKLAQVCHARAMFDKCAAKGITFFVVHPGACNSDIWQTFQAPSLLRAMVQSVAATIFLTTEQGAAASVHAATKEITPESSRALEHFGPYATPLPGWECLTDAWQPTFTKTVTVTKSDTSVASRDPKLGQELIQLSDQLLDEWEKAAVEDHQ